MGPSDPVEPLRSLRRQHHRIRSGETADDHNAVGSEVLADDTSIRDLDTSPSSTLVDVECIDAPCVLSIPRSVNHLVMLEESSHPSIEQKRAVDLQQVDIGVVVALDHPRPLPCHDDVPTHVREET